MEFRKTFTQSVPSYVYYWERGREVPNTKPMGSRMAGIYGYGYSSQLFQNLADLPPLRPAFFPLPMAKVNSTLLGLNETEAKK